MPNAEADALISTLPQPQGLQIFREGDAIVMAGGKQGAHSIHVSVSSATRLLCHSRSPSSTTSHPVPTDRICPYADPSGGSPTWALIPDPRCLAWFCQLPGFFADDLQNLTVRCALRDAHLHGPSQHPPRAQRLARS